MFITNKIQSRLGPAAADISCARREICYSQYLTTLLLLLLCVLTLKRLLSPSTNSETYSQVMNLFHFKVLSGANPRSDTQTRAELQRLGKLVGCPCDETVHLFFDAAVDVAGIGRPTKGSSLPRGVSGLRLAMRSSCPVPLSLATQTSKEKKAAQFSYRMLLLELHARKPVRSRLRRL